MVRVLALSGASVAALLIAAPSLARPVDRAPAATEASYRADRRDILAMAGTFRVRFDMQETTAWQSGYTPLERKLSGGHEVVRVVEDGPRRIVLQHLLVVEHDGQSHVIKHWRQDWEYQPTRVLAYAGPGRWTWEAVPETAQPGAWSQTVYQVDDSPRYAGWGRWESVAGMRRWTSNATWRPLARRDAVRKPVYDRYHGINRHQPTPDGWVHWQDNIKMGTVDGALTPIVQEQVLNTYTRFDGFDVKTADDYWRRTKDFWAAVRTEWEKAAAAGGGVTVTEEAETGTVVSARLLALADEVAAAKQTQTAAVAEAGRLIAGRSEVATAATPLAAGR